MFRRYLIRGDVAACVNYADFRMYGATIKMLSVNGSYATSWSTSGVQFLARAKILPSILT